MRGERMLIDTSLRASVSLVDMELRSVVGFYEHTDGSFTTALNRFDRETAKRDAAYWNEDVWDGMTRGDFRTEERIELVGLAEWAGYFGILIVYSILERYLYQLFKYAKDFDIDFDAKSKKKHSLDFQGYKDFLKQLKIHITQPPFRYQELSKLRTIRNAIAHEGGWVTEENQNKLRPYKLSLGEHISITDKYFRSSVGLVGDTCSQLSKKFENVLMKGATTVRGHQRSVKQVRGHI